MELSIQLVFWMGKCWLDRIPLFYTKIDTYIKPLHQTPFRPNKTVQIRSVFQIQGKSIHNILYYCICWYCHLDFKVIFWLFVHYWSWYWLFLKQFGSLWIKIGSGVNTGPKGTEGKGLVTLLWLFTQGYFVLLSWLICMILYL